MFSRSGKSTNNQYVVFQNKGDNEVESKVAKIIYRGDDQNNRNKKKGLEDVSENSSENDEDESVPNDFKTKVQDNKPLTNKKGDDQKNGAGASGGQQQASGNYVGLTRAQILNEQKMELKKNSIQAEMIKIQHQIAEQKLSENQKIRRMLKAQQGKKAKITTKDV